MPNVMPWAVLLSSKNTFLEITLPESEQHCENAQFVENLMAQPLQRQTSEPDLFKSPKSQDVLAGRRCWLFNGSVDASPTITESTTTMSPDPHTATMYQLESSARSSHQGEGDHSTSEDAADKGTWVSPLQHGAKVANHERMPSDSTSKARPGKLKRERYRRIVSHLMEQVDLNPHAFDMDLIALPPSVSHNHALKAKLEKRMQSYVAEKLGESAMHLPTSPIFQHESTSVPGQLHHSLSKSCPQPCQNLLDANAFTGQAIPISEHVSSMMPWLQAPRCTADSTFLGRPSAYDAHSTSDSSALTSNPPPDQVLDDALCHELLVDSESTPTLTSSALGPHTPDVKHAGRTRPCKEQRLRHRKLVSRLYEKIDRNPEGFDLEHIDLPPSLVQDNRRNAKLKRNMLHYKAMLCRKVEI